MEEKTRIKRSGRGWLNPLGHQTRGSGAMAQVKDSRIYDRISARCDYENAQSSSITGVAQSSVRVYLMVLKRDQELRAHNPTPLP